MAYSIMFQNKFLNDFMKTQTQLVHDAVSTQAVKKDKKKRYKSKHGTPDGAAPFGEVTLETLISEKPPKKEILEYFRNKVAELIAEDMA
jgi:hypothetical protein